MKYFLVINSVLQSLKKLLIFRYSLRKNLTSSMGFFKQNALFSRIFNNISHGKCLKKRRGFKTCLCYSLLGNGGSPQSTAEYYPQNFWLSRKSKWWTFSKTLVHYRTPNYSVAIDFHNWSDSSVNIKSHSDLVVLAKCFICYFSFVGSCIPITDEWPL